MMTMPKRLYCALGDRRIGFDEPAPSGDDRRRNAWLADQRKDGPDDLLTLVTFDAPQVPTKPRVRVLYDGVPFEEVAGLNSGNYCPDGGTPLYDAIGGTISRIEGDPRSADRTVVLVVMTDGLENASVEYTHEAIAARVEQKERDGWTIMYLGANQDAKQVAAGMRLDADFAVNYEPSVAGTAMAYGATSAATKAVRRAESPMAVSESLHAASSKGEHPR